MVWKGKEEFINAGNKIVWLGMAVFILGLFLAFTGSGSDLVLMFIMTSAQAFGIGLVLIGSVVFLVGRLRED
ncbi:MAG: hypothetical protein AB9860_05485 [Methanomassiliicoccales archaeon]